jgi:hypothetical protein
MDICTKKVFEIISLNELRSANTLNFLNWSLYCDDFKKEGDPDVKPVHLMCTNSQLFGGKFVSVSKFSYSVALRHFSNASDNTCLVRIFAANYLRGFMFFQPFL